MKACLFNSISTNRRTTAYRVVRWITIDAALGAVCGALFGMVFGVIGLLLEPQPWGIVSIAMYFALCGAAAGALVGACGAVLEGGDASSTGLSPVSASTRITAVLPTVDDPAVRNDPFSRLLPYNRLIALDRRGQTARESMKPSRN